MDVKILQATDYARWDQFVLDHPQGSFFHKAGWQTVIEQSFGHKTWFCYVEQEQQIVGILPLSHINSWLFANALISLPFCVYGGILANNDDVAQVLYQYAKQLAVSLNVDYLEMRYLEPPAVTALEKDLYVTFQKTISDNEEENLKAIPRKQRAMVRKGIKAGLSSVIHQDLEQFYAIYAESVRNLGTPVFRKKYFYNLYQTFAGDCELLSVNTPDGQAIASVMSFYFKDQVLPYYGGSLPLARAVKGNDFMYWQLLNHAAMTKGCRIFDYGRSKQGTGSYRFKKNWGFEPKPLHYQYYLVKATEMPNINPLNPKYQWFIKLWKNLPLSIANRLGPFLVKNIG